MSLRVGGGVGGGVGSWLMDEEEDEWRDEVGESYYLDMLRDGSRNEAYEDGLRRAIESVREKAGDNGVGVLDIGTGSGLLALIASRQGGDRVTACECFLPVAKVAEKCIEANGADIKLVMKASTKMILEEMHTAKPADIIVNELYDTELLGEGILPTLRHAFENLTVPDAIVVPAKADIVVRLLESHQFWTGHTPSGHTPGGPRAPGGADLFAPPTGRLLAGASPPRNPQAASKTQRTYTSESFFVDKLVESGAAAWQSASKVAAGIDFCDPPAHGTHNGEAVEIQCLGDGLVHAIVYWWDLRMCPWDTNPAAERELGSGDRPSQGVLSMSPGGGFRDHWRQNVCVLPAPIPVKAGDTITIVACHDDWRVWFSVSPQGVPARGGGDCPEHPRGARLLCGGNRLRTYADPGYIAPFADAISRLVTGESVCVDVGHGHLLAMLAAEREPALVVDAEDSGKAYGIASAALSALVGESGAATAVLVDDMEEAARGDEDDEGGGGCVAGALGGKLITLIMAEPWFFECGAGAGSGGGGTQVDNLRFWRVGDSMRRSGLCAESCEMMPRRARLVGVAVEFEELRSPQAPVDQVMGLDLSAFSGIQPGGEGKPLRPTSYELWMYGWRPLTPEFSVMDFDFSKPPGDILSNSLCPRSGPEAGTWADAVGMSSTGTCHAVVMWLEYDLCDGVPPVSCGPGGAGMHHHRQMVWFLEGEAQCRAGESRLTVAAGFEEEGCELSVRFQVS